MTETTAQNVDNVKPHKNYMWALCDTTMKAQLSTGQVLNSNALIANALSTLMDALSNAYVGDPNAPFTPDKDPTSGSIAGHTLTWYVDEMQYLAGQASSKTDQKLSFEMSFVQQTYSLTNTSMQENVNVLNNSTQAESQQTQQDNSALQGLITLASTGNGSATYAANLMQQTMA
ncbi:hypothetical protein [Simkania sp.]|uniref:hypothetical protein n=1 Tax=Simkania sp. TaxID=34094 RepID=UPI003B52959F